TSGVRLTVGGWLNSEQSLGIEGSGFLLEQRSFFFRADSDANGNPFLGFPIFSVSPDATFGQSAIPVTFPAVPPPTQAAGGLAVTANSRFWGAEVNGVLNGMRNEQFSLDLLFGFRYADLQENLDFFGNSLTTDGPGNSIQVAGADHFGTRNQFYGGQI